MTISCGTGSRLIAECCSLALAACAFVLFSPALPGSAAKDVPVIGYIEEVILLPWGVKLPARVDTGASMTSLDARDVVVKENKVTFKLPQDFGEREFELPLNRWGRVSSAMGIQERPVVEIELCVGASRYKVKANLIDRSSVRFPVIIGRNLLRHEFLVNPSKRHLQPPSCGETPSK